LAFICSFTLRKSVVLQESCKTFIQKKYDWNKYKSTFVNFSLIHFAYKIVAFNEFFMSYYKYLIHTSQFRAYQRSHAIKLLDSFSELCNIFFINCSRDILASLFSEKKTS
jgi:hypothetical protein